MKLLSSSSSVSFDPKMCTSKSATAGCLAGILRRFLCSGSLPTHPSDHTTDASSEANYYTKQQQVINAVDNKYSDDASKVTPGIVARLMGLDSLLETQVNPNSITRSRSMNSADYNKQDHHTIHGKHRRVNSTLSFREMPTYLELENDEFFVLSFEKEMVRSKGKSEELKQIKEDDEHASKRVLKVLDEEKLNRRILVKPNQDMAKSNEVVIRKGQEYCSKCDAVKLRKKKKKMQHLVDQTVEPKCISEDSSPVSVLDFDQFIIDDHDVLTSGWCHSFN